MKKYREIKGDLISFAKQGHFDVIGHGCNCFCTMGAGLAPQMAEHFGCHYYPLENEFYRGDERKLGKIDYTYYRNTAVVNMYTQYKPGKDLVYSALEHCLKELNREFQGKHIGLPQIGCGIAGGDWNIVSQMIKKNLKDCYVTVVIYDQRVTEYEIDSVWNTIKKFVIKYIN